MIHVIHRKLPCEHQFVRVDSEAFRRVCRTCKKAWKGRLVKSDASEHVGHEVLRVEWEEA